MFEFSQAAFVNCPSSQRFNQYLVFALASSAGVEVEVDLDDEVGFAVLEVLIVLVLCALQASFVFMMVASVCSSTMPLFCEGWGVCVLCRSGVLLARSALRPGRALAVKANIEPIIRVKYFILRNAGKENKKSPRSSKLWSEAQMAT